MDSRSLVPASPSFQLPVANLRSVFQTHDVERKLAKLPEREHEHLRTTYERMLERGPDRFQVKPSGVPEMASLYAQLPNFTEVAGRRAAPCRPGAGQPRRPRGHADAAARRARHRQDPFRARSWPSCWAPACRWCR